MPGATRTNQRYRGWWREIPAEHKLWGILSMVLGISMLTILLLVADDHSTYWSYHPFLTESSSALALGLIGIPLGLFFVDGYLGFFRKDQEQRAEAVRQTADEAKRRQEQLAEAIDRLYQASTIRLVFAFALVQEHVKPVLQSTSLEGLTLEAEGQIDIVGKLRSNLQILAQCWREVGDHAEELATSASNIPKLRPDARDMLIGYVKKYDETVFDNDVLLGGLTNGIDAVLDHVHSITSVLMEKMIIFRPWSVKHGYRLHAPDLDSVSLQMTLAHATSEQGSTVANIDVVAMEKWLRQLSTLAKDMNRTLNYLELHVTT